MNPPTHTSSVRRQFARLAQRPDDQIDLTEGALLIAAQEQPGLDPDPCRRDLDLWSQQLRERLDGLDDDLGRLDALCRFTFEEKRLAGDDDEYHHPANCLLNRVVERRKGIPITLGLVLLELGRRVGIPLEGVGFPGHFLVRHGHHPEILLDPFHRGCLVTVEDCSALLRRITRGRIPFSRSLLRPSSPRQILLRILNNLRGTYLSLDQVDRALSVVDRMLLLCPGDACLLRDRGILRLKAGYVDAGVRDLERYLEAEPDAEDWNDLAERIEEVRYRADALDRPVEH